MADKILEIIEALEPILLIVIPAAFAVWVKVSGKIKEEKTKIEKKNKNTSKQKLLDWRHKESIRVTYKLKETCNYYRDLTGFHASFIQLENGTVATSKLSNMFFSCIAEDNRYSNSLRVSSIIQRIPFVKLSNWFDVVYHSNETATYFTNTNQLDDIIKNNEHIKSIISGVVKNPEGVVIGVCNLSTYDTERTEEELHKVETEMIKFISSVETIFLTFNLELNKKLEELDLLEMGE